MDRRWFRRATQSPAPILDSIMFPLSRFADHGTLWVATAAALHLTGRPALQRAGRRGLLSLIVTSIIANVGFKPIFRRPRPLPVPDAWLTRIVPLPSSTSFPSGHASSAAGFAVGAALEAPLLAVPLGLLAAGVGWSRVRLRVHYPGDVMVGFAVGAAVAVACRPIPVEKRREPEQAEAEPTELEN